MSFEKRLETYRERVEASLAYWLPKSNSVPCRLHEAMRYAVLGGGKRIRPLLVYATGETLGAPVEQLDGPACAVELIHAYSLVHDDLPAMDDDDIRRGRPTCHKAYDEGTAVLVGDALQSLAFEVLARDRALIDDPMRRIAIFGHLAEAAGSRGMAGGQALDLAASGTSLSVEELDQMHILKTGALIRASVHLAAQSFSDITAQQLSRLDRFGTQIGLAFQIQDDILDATGTDTTLGKSAGADQANNKSTYTQILGLEAAQDALHNVYGEALSALEIFGERAEPLRTLARLIVERDH